MRKRKMAQAIVALLVTFGPNDWYLRHGSRATGSGFRPVQRCIMPSIYRERLFLLLYILRANSDHKAEITSIIASLKGCQSPQALQDTLTAQLNTHIKATCLMKSSVFKTWNTGVAAHTVLLLKKNMPAFFRMLEPERSDSDFAEPDAGSFMHQLLRVDGVVTEAAVKTALPRWFDSHGCLSLNFDAVDLSEDSDDRPTPDDT